jgi:hypothetical protein
MNVLPSLKLLTRINIMQGTQGRRWMRKMDRDGIVIHIDRKEEEK